MKYIYAALISALVLISGIWYGETLHKNLETTVAGSAFSPVQGQTYYLAGAGITNTASSIQLTSATLPDPNKTPLQMSMFGSIGYAVLEPQSSKIENISFTGITQNPNGTAILTGVARGLSFYSTYAASTTLALSHAGGATLILSNSAAFYGQQFALINSPESIGAVWKFGSTTPPVYDFNPNFTGAASTTFASKGYVDGQIAAGGSPADTSTAGISILATAAQIAASTATKVFNAVTYNLVIPSSLATSTPTAACTTGCVPVAVNGVLSQLFIGLTQAFTWTGLHTFTAGFIDTASSTLNSRVNFAASDTSTHGVCFNGVCYQFPSSQGLTNQVWVNNGSGVLVNGYPAAAQYSMASTSQSSIVTNKTITSAQLSIPAGILTASSTVTVSGVITCATGGSGGNCTVSLIDTNSNQYCSQSLSPGTTGVEYMSFSMNSFANGSLSSQSGSMNGIINQQSGNPIDGSGACGGSVNWANATNFEIRYVTSNTTGVTGTLSPFTLTVRP